DKRFGVIRDASGLPCAFAMAVADGASIGLFNLLSAPAHRRRGLGRTLVEVLLAEAHRAGARAAWLQVAADNRPAVMLYESLGFVEAYRYHYRLSGDPGRDA